jgi:hypothetical protein
MQDRYKKRSSPPTPDKRRYRKLKPALAVLRIRLL